MATRVCKPIATRARERARAKCLEEQSCRLTPRVGARRFRCSFFTPIAACRLQILQRVRRRHVRRRGTSRKRSKYPGPERFGGSRSRLLKTKRPELISQLGPSS
jgi:hypothetical protein